MKNTERSLEASRQHLWPTRHSPNYQSISKSIRAVCSKAVRVIHYLLNRILFQILSQIVCRLLKHARKSFISSQHTDTRYLCKEARCTSYSIASHISIFLLSELGNHTHCQLSQTSHISSFFHLRSFFYSHTC